MLHSIYKIYHFVMTSLNLRIQKINTYYSQNILLTKITINLDYHKPWTKKSPLNGGNSSFKICKFRTRADSKTAGRENQSRTLANILIGELEKLSAASSSTLKIDGPRCVALGLLSTRTWSSPVLMSLCPKIRKPLPIRFTLSLNKISGLLTKRLQLHKTVSQSK